MKRFGCLAGLTLGGMIIMAQTNGTGETVTTNFEHAIHNIPGKSWSPRLLTMRLGEPRPRTSTQNRPSRDRDPPA
jgi:hypothetical protein